MKTCIVLGSNSDIAKGLIPLLDYNVVPWARGEAVPVVWWDLCLITIGKVAPVGNWWEQPEDEWNECIYSNLIAPFMLLRDIWPWAKVDARVCFFAGSNPNQIMPGYSAYNVSKMGLLKLVEQLDEETPDAVFFALGPGVTDTKIHQATRDKGWPNPRLQRADKDGSFTSIEQIHKCLEWCIEQPKSVVGGRNICVSDMNYRHGNLTANLQQNEGMFKLRRNEGPRLL
jgi:NAD(P)-dependent dehydrogenase (short-subunit alcohol dehydrogenase family)